MRLILLANSKRVSYDVVCFGDVVEVCGAQVPLRGGGEAGGVLCAVRLVSGLPRVGVVLQPKPHSSLHRTNVCHQRDHVAPGSCQTTDHRQFIIVFTATTTVTFLTEDIELTCRPVYFILLITFSGKVLQSVMFVNLFPQFVFTLLFEATDLRS